MFALERRLGLLHSSVKGRCDISNPFVLGAVYCIHLLATVLWIGGILTNAFVFVPSAQAALDPPSMGKFMGAVMKRFRPMVYICMLLLMVTGGVMTVVNPSYSGAMKFTNLWTTLSLIKHIVVLLMVVIAVVMFEVVVPKMGKLAAKGPSPELAKLQGLQAKLGMFGVLLVLAILYLTGVMNSISALTV